MDQYKEYFKIMIEGKLMLIRFFAFMFFLQLRTLVFADLIDLKTQEKRQKEVKSSFSKQRKTKDPALSQAKETKKNKSKAKRIENKPPVQQTLWHEDMPVRFGSEKMSGFRSDGLLFLEGKVWLKQGDLNLSADKATVYFYTHSESVEKVVVKGNTTITKIDEKTAKKISAKSHEAIFFIKKKELLLEGEAILTRGREIVAGDKIKYQIESGEVSGVGIRGVADPASVKQGQVSFK